jgi:predicted RNA binding protein YcfA (HicA-like mRNA interferase family)
VKLPRDVSGTDLVKALKVLGYERVRQDGSPIRLTTQVNGCHHITVPCHKALKTGTLLGAVLKPVASHHGLTIEDLLSKLNL